MEATSVYLYRGRFEIILLFKVLHIFIKHVYNNGGIFNYPHKFGHLIGDTKY